jgi:hypothetical protein
VFVSGFGQRYSNGSMDGALDLMYKKSIDFYFKPEALDVLGDGVLHSVAINSEKLHVGHRFPEPWGKVHVIKMLAALPVQGWLALVFSFAIISTLFSVRSTDLTLTIRFDLIHFLHSAMTAVQMFFLQLDTGIVERLAPRVRALIFPIIISLHIITSMILISVKSDQVVMDSNIVLNTLEDVLQSNRRMLWMRNERAVPLFSKAPPDTIYGKVWRMRGEYMSKTVTGSMKAVEHQNDCAGVMHPIFLLVCSLS